MYDKDGDFGRVRLTMPPRITQLEPYFAYVARCGWHSCNDKYQINRLDNDDTNLLFYTTSGMGELRTGGKKYSLTPDTVTILTPNVPAAYYTPEGGMWEFYWIHFKGKPCQPLIELISCQDSKLITMGGCGCVRDTVECLLASKGGESVRSCIKHSEMLLHMLHQIAARISFDSFPENGYSQITKSALALIHSYYTTSFELSDISKRLYISSEHLIRIFKKDLGVTPHMYLLRHRIEKGKQLLRQTSLSVESVSQMVGFKSHSNFSKQFRDMEGKTPTLYRKSI